MTITEFINARIEEDQADAWRDFGNDDSPGTWHRYVLDQCAALRAVVELHTRVGLSPIYQCASCGVAAHNLGARFPCGTIRAIAAVWRDHDDYRAEWA